MLSKFIICISFLPILVVFGDPCKNNSDCFGNAICNNETCACDRLSYNDSGTCLQYVTEYRQYCQKDDQCTWLGNNSGCISNVCVCKPKFRWFQGQCEAYVSKGEDCTSDINCFDKLDPLALRCSSGKCICSNGYYERGSDCRHESMIDGKCAIDFDCKGSNNLGCERGKCTEVKGSTLFNASREVSRIRKSHFLDFEDTSNNKLDKPRFTSDSGDIKCVYDSDCVNMKNSVCDQSTYTCKCDNLTQFLYNGNCLPGFKSCIGNDDCSSFSNTYCFLNTTCICKQGFFFNGTTCIPELGMISSSLKSINDCFIKPAKFSENACYCLDYWFVDDTNRNCIKTTLQQFLSCLNNDWCDVMGPNSFCNSKTNQCECASFAKLNEDTFYCEGTNNKNVCLRDSDCPYNKQCLDEKCSCVENFVEDKNGTCQPALGASCKVLPCYAENSGCMEGVCNCNSNHLDYQEQCLKIAESWSDSCDVSEQCRNFKFSQCSSKQCRCITNYKKVNDACWEIKDYGDPCMSELECTQVIGKSVQCRNSKCQCPIGQTWEKGYCVSGASSYLKPSLLVFFMIFIRFIH